MHIVILTIIRYLSMFEIFEIGLIALGVIYKLGVKFVGYGIVCFGVSRGNYWQPMINVLLFGAAFLTESVKIKLCVLRGIAHL